MRPFSCSGRSRRGSNPGRTPRAVRHFIPIKKQDCLVPARGQA
ncbi:hypothetical protein GDI3848 [Gluconacetobacter diazotrophicus PA1 5]|uniref:Uncharacterized protein n=1 Tax=Gluconacetobacter diazotrophicus (strain ATCC 49037 / DSM 5601 / CCUG 37298 / CIP 103539 / LMG 7603 / PAl5) TaxID=272568 RepID=A9HA43_GLUDA|nr:hypothetical protein GDI3848 [Gluconacetobacter diazotrophicus PA1 5]